MKPIFGANDVIYRDDGRGYDLTAGDGFYTSEVVFDHNDKVAFTDYKSKMINNKIALPANFKHQEKLVSFINEQRGSESAKTEILSYTCSIGFISCSSGGNCLACYVYDATCYYLYDCHWEIGFGL